MSARYFFFFFGLFFVGSLSALVAQTNDWNVGAGGNPARNGISTHFGPESDFLLWEGSLGSVIAQQAAIDDNVVLSTRIFNLGDTQGGTLLVAQDLFTGDTLWTKDLPVDFPDTDWRTRLSAAQDGVVYATRSGNTNASFLYALDLEDGSLLWKSEDLIDESSTESAAFTSDGDLVIGNFNSVIRIKHEDGTTVWETPRSTPTSNGQSVAVYGNRGYYWESSPFGPVISVIDLETGEYLYESNGIGGGLVQQVNPFVGPNGTVYAPRTQNNAISDTLVAFRDNGTNLERLWSIPIGYVPFATFGVGPDGSVYSYSAEGEILRLNPEDGSVLNTSQQIFTSISASPRMAIDAAGYIFVTNSETADGALYSFNPDLTFRWSVPITNVNVGGPAIGQNGTLVVCGIGSNVQAYAGTGPSNQEEVKSMIDLAVFPNPTSGQLTLKGQALATNTWQIIDIQGRVIWQRSNWGETILELEVGHWPAGSYFIQVLQNGQMQNAGQFQIIH
jgi:outer membrane protein assembly factor BamB